ncbi:MAG: YbgA family protein [Desulfonatronovibrio sp.]
MKIGISTCLLGENVRYDGGHKLNRYLRDELGKYVNYIPVCPETESGLPVPREAMRLVGDPENPRLVTIQSRVDHTGRLEEWGRQKLEELDKENLCGFIFKAKSPSSGMERVKVYNDKGHPVPRGRGVFAGMFMDKFPLVPVEEDGRLNDPGLRENFIARIFVFNRWLEIRKKGLTAGRLVDFHSRHKLLLMAHNISAYRELGRMVAKASEYDPEVLAKEYISRLMNALKLSSTIKKNVNVLQHVMGYFKKDLTSDEKQELLEVIKLYADSLVPIIVPITLLNHYVRKYGKTYLSQQVYLNPHPMELKLRNHV